MIYPLVSSNMGLLENLPTHSMSLWAGKTICKWEMFHCRFWLPEGFLPVRVYYTYIYIFIYMHAVYIYIDVYIQTYIHTYIYIVKIIYIYMYVCTYTYTCVYVCVCVFVWIAGFQVGCATSCLLLHPLKSTWKRTPVISKRKSIMMATITPGSGSQTEERFLVGFMGTPWLMGPQFPYCSHRNPTILPCSEPKLEVPTIYKAYVS